jgi:hypothetical protein
MTSDLVTTAIRNWHRPITTGANHYDGGLQRHCTECRHPWPCRTYQLTEERKR